MLKIFDLDRTLVPFDSNALFPQAIEMLRECKRQGDSVAVVTNQGGPACRDAGWGDKYPRYGDVVKRINEVHYNIYDILGRFCVMYTSFLYQAKSGAYLVPNQFADFRDALANGSYSTLPEMIHPANRKPNSGHVVLAITDYLALHKVDGIKVKISKETNLPFFFGLDNEVMFYGDSEDDRIAAQGAGIPFTLVEWGK